MGWATDAAGDNIFDLWAGLIIGSSIRLYAQWEPGMVHLLPVYFCGNGGFPEMRRMLFLPDSSPDEWISRVGQPEKWGHKFIEWRLGDGTSYDITPGSPFFYAYWEWIPVAGTIFGGSAWRLYSDGTLMVDGGYIHWGFQSNPWFEYGRGISRIVFTGPIMGGNSLRNLFSGLGSLTSIEGLDYFNTSNVTDMTRLFNAHRLTSLDLSSWNTSNVTYMSFMFSGAGRLMNLNLSSWDTSNVTTMEGIFQNAHLLRELTLGENFHFVGDDAGLPAVPQNDTYTGYWQNVGSGTVRNPLGEHVFTSEELIENYDGATMADTWVWQPRNPSIHPFTDIDNHWAYEAIEYVYENGLMRGITPTTFAPNARLNRAMLTTTLWRMMGEPAADFQPVFSDVPSTAPAWYRDAVMWAYENGIARGIDGRFDPYGEITREQFAAMIHRYAQLLGICTNVPEFFNLDSFQDRDEISGWAEPYMDWAVFRELIQGVNAQTLAPSGTATRAQSAAILMRFLERLADGGFFV